MITAPAPAAPDSHALLPAAAGTATNFFETSTSFQSVYQNLPIDSLSPNPKELRSVKKDAPKGADDSLPAITTLPLTTDISPQRPWLPAQPMFSLTAQTTTIEPASAQQALSTAPGLDAAAFRAPLANDVEARSGRPTLVPEPEVDALTPDPATTVNNIRQGPIPAYPLDPVAAMIKPTAAAQSLAGPILQPTSVAESVSNVLTLPGKPSTPAVPALQQSLSAGTTNPMQPTAATTAVPAAPIPSAPIRTGTAKLERFSSASATARQLALVRQPESNSQDSGIAPVLSLGAPLLPPEPQTPAADLGTPDSREPAESSFRGSALRSLPQHSIDPSLVTKGLVATLAPRTSNLAFSLRLLEADSLSRRTPAAPQPGPARNQAANQAKNDEHPLAPQPAPAASRAATFSDGVSTGPVNLLWSEASAHPRLEMRQEVQLSEPHESANSTVVAALHETQPVPPETPRPNATGEILLQLGGKDQPAAIRLTDRAGAVNVSVHAADPELRSSLRSNLGDLASQLTHQGWKTDVIKPGTVLTRAETSQDSQPDGQRSSSHQQPFANGERQPQRDRRANSEQWLAEFEEQESGKSQNPRGTN